MNRYIMVGWGICEKYQLRDSQISRAETAREILSQNWNFSQLPHPIVIFLFNYTKYTFVPWRMRLHKKGVSWTWNTIIFIWKHIFLWECNRDRCSNGLCLPYLLTYDVYVMSSDRQKKPWENQIKFGTKVYARVKAANPKIQIPHYRG